MRRRPRALATAVFRIALGVSASALFAAGYAWFRVRVLGDHIQIARPQPDLHLSAALGIAALLAWSNAGVLVAATMLSAGPPGDRPHVSEVYASSAASAVAFVAIYPLMYDYPQASFFVFGSVCCITAIVVTRLARRLPTLPPSRGGG